jgi:hypothetical protein
MRKTTAKNSTRLDRQTINKLERLVAALILELPEAGREAG